MANVIAEKLDKCIEKHLNAMQGFDVGSDEMNGAINDLVKLYKYRMDEQKLDYDYEHKNDQNDLEGRRIDNEKDFKDAQMELETKKVEQDTADKVDRRALERERIKADTDYRGRQLDLETKKVDLDDADKTKRLAIERTKIDIENAKISLETDQVKEQKTDRYFRLGIAAAELVLPLVVYTGLAMLGYAREFDGVITSQTLKRVTNDIKFKK